MEATQVSLTRARELYQLGSEYGEAEDIYDDQGVANVVDHLGALQFELTGQQYRSDTLFCIGADGKGGRVSVNYRLTVPRQRLNIAVAVAHNSIHFEQFVFDHSDYAQKLARIAPGTVAEIRFADEMGYATQEARFFAAGLLLARRDPEVPVGEIGDRYQVPQRWAENHLGALGHTALASPAV